ncbi:MAG TPA: hypothetical protein PKA53_00680 [Sphingobacterium sp.]|nr:hypothetical protein [Sphingobacterium sp.]
MLDTRLSIMVDINIIKKENTEILTDLIVINQERILGYAKAIAGLDSEKDSDLISIFEQYSQQAQQFKSQLIPLVHREGEIPDNTCDPAPEKLYKTWFEASGIVDSNPRESVLIAVIRGEKDNERIYRIALDNLEVVEENVLEMIRSQADLQSSSHENLRTLLVLETEQE